MSGEPLVVVTHPLADNQPDEVARKAEAIVEEVVSVLSEPAETLAKRYRDRFSRIADRRRDVGAVCIDEVCIVDVDRGV